MLLHRGDRVAGNAELALVQTACQMGRKQAQTVASAAK